MLEVIIEPDTIDAAAHPEVALDVGDQGNIEV